METIYDLSGVKINRRCADGTTLIGYSQEKLQIECLRKCEKMGLNVPW